MMKTFIISLLYLYPILCHARVRPFETTRLMSQSGAGIGSILSVESAFLNPASIAFYNQSQIYYQRTQASINGDDNNLRNKTYGSAHNEAYVLSDVTTHLKGNIAYIRQSENSYNSELYTLSMSAPAGKNSAMGIATTYGHDTTEDNSHKYYMQSTIGLTHVLSEELSLGAIWVDAFNRGVQHHFLAVGIQYLLFPKVMVLADLGSNTRLDASENMVSRYATQVNFFGDFYLRAGQHHDKIQNLKGSSWGLSWIGPKIDFHYAYKKSKQLKKDNLFLFSDEELVEQSYSLSFRF